jgi:ATP/maltotriose-dependent transcriptional regulator MalT
VLASLINELAAIPGRIILVLDDHHTIESSPVNNALAFLLERLPPQMHLVIASREDPHLPLARLRARGQLTELVPLSSPFFRFVAPATRPAASELEGKVAPPGE